MEAGKVWESWAQISRWYRQARGVQASPTTEALDKVTVDRTEIYRCRPPKGLRVPLLMRQADIKDGTPTKAEVSEAVRGLKGVRSGGPPGTCSEDLKLWLWEATHKKGLARIR